MPATQNYITQDSGDARYQALGGLSAGTPSNANVADAGTAGVSPSASRADHGHVVPSATPVATGDANAAGVATTHVRSDHVHKGVVANDAWTSYTPTLEQPSGTAVTKTVTYAKWARYGRTILVEVFLVVTGAGTGASIVEVGLPVAPAQGAFGVLLGSGFIFDSSVAVGYAGIPEVATASTGRMRSTAAAQGWLGTITFTAALAVGDEVRFAAIYEAAT